MSTKYLNYETVSWQGFIQMIVYLAGTGYYHWHLIYLPESKKEKWPAIDKKLITKYGMDISKFTRRDRKKRKFANFYYLRWENVVLLLHTDGEILDAVIKKIEKQNDTIDQFFDIRKTRLSFKIGDYTSFDIYYEKGKIGVKLSKECYRKFKDHLYDVAHSKNPIAMKKAFERINGYPSWAGVYAQKKMLAKFLVSQAKKNNVKLSTKDLRIISKRIVYKVFK